MKSVVGGFFPSAGAIRTVMDTARFNPRRFLVLTAALSALCLPFSGLEVHLHQFDSILSAPRHGWMAIHVTLGVLFLVSVVAHAGLNRRTLVNYIFGGVARSAPSREALAAVATVCVVLLVAATHAFG